MFVPEKLKKLIRKALTRFALTYRMYLKSRVYTFELDEKTVRGKIQKVGHGMDLRLSSGRPIPSSLIWEFEFLLDQIHRKNVAIDEALLWAFSVYVVAKRGLRSQYNSGVERPSQKRTGQDNDMKLLDAIPNRRSVRKWKSEQLQLDEIEKIIDLARWAPSSCNRQLWKVLLINTESEKQFLTGYFPNTFWLKAPVLAVVMTDSGIYGSRERHFAYLDGAAFIQNMLLAIEAFSYGACWIGFKGWDSLGNVYGSAQDYEEFYRHFNLKKSLVPVSMIALGKPDIVPRIPPRQNVDAILIKGFYR